MHFVVLGFIAAAASASAQAVVGTAYGFGAGATGGGRAAAVTPTTNDELANYLSDNVARVILISKTFDFAGQTSSGPGCYQKSCSVASGGQLYLGTLSCGNSDNVTVSSITYDSAGLTPLVVGSNKSVLGVGGKGVLKGKGLSIKNNASNVIIQGIEFTTINPKIVLGGDAITFQGGNTKIWVDHCKFSLIGRMFVVSQFGGSRATLSNNEFNGVTTTSATCNSEHFWTVMFIGGDEKLTLDKNYFHDVSGRAPQLGQNGVSGMFHAINNYFENMKGYAFNAYYGAHVLVEGNAFKAVSQPSTDHTATDNSFISDAGPICALMIGRDCLANSIDSASGKLATGSYIYFIYWLASVDVPTKLDASNVAAYVKANAGPSNLGGTEVGIAVSTMLITTKLPAAITTKANTTAITTTRPAAKTTTVATSSSATASLYAQCGGPGFTGPTRCAPPAYCVKMNDWYSQCIDISS